MVNYAQLRDLDTTNLLDTAKSVGKLGEKLDGHADTVRGASNIASDIWVGTDTESAHFKILDQAPPLEDAGQALRHARELLSDLVVGLLTAKKQLAAATSATDGTPLTIGDDGTVHLQPGLPKNLDQYYKKRAVEVAGMIEDALKTANEADDEAAGGLKKMGTPDDPGDTGPDYDIKEAGRAADLMEKAGKGDLSDEEAAELKRLLGTNKRDTEFIEELGRELKERGITDKKDGEGDKWTSAFLEQFNLAENEIEGGTDRLGRPGGADGGMPDLSRVDFSELSPKLAPDYNPEHELWKKEAGDTWAEGEKKDSSHHLGTDIDTESKYSTGWAAETSGVLNKEGFEATGEAKVEALAETSTTFKDKYAELSLGTGASVEAGVEGHASLTKDGLSIGGEGFAGGKAKLEGGYEAGGLGVEGLAEGWAGPGGEAGLDVGKGEDGKYHVRASLGASPLLGGKLGVGLTFDPKGFAETVGGPVKRFTDWLS